MLKFRLLAFIIFPCDLELISKQVNYMYLNKLKHLLYKGAFKLALPKDFFQLPPNLLTLLARGVDPEKKYHYI